MSQDSAYIRRSNFAWPENVRRAHQANLFESLTTQTSAKTPGEWRGDDGSPIRVHATGVLTLLAHTSFSQEIVSSLHLKRGINDVPKYVGPTEVSLEDRQSAVWGQAVVITRELNDNRLLARAALDRLGIMVVSDMQEAAARAAEPVPAP